MKRICMNLIIGIFFVVAALGSAHASDKVYQLKIADSFPIKHPFNKVVNHFMEAAKKESNGRLDFQYFPAQQLGKLHDMLKIAQKGLADITYVGPTFFPGQLGLNTVATLPNCSIHSAQPSRARYTSKPFTGRAEAANLLPLFVKTKVGL